jgi:hypothetical protein
VDHSVALSGRVVEGNEPGRAVENNRPPHTPVEAKNNRLRIAIPQDGGAAVPRLLISPAVASDITDDIDSDQTPPNLPPKLKGLLKHRKAKKDDLLRTIRRMLYELNSEACDL